MYPDKKRTSLSGDERSSNPHQPPQAVSSSSRAPRRIYARPAMAYANTNNPYLPARQRSPSPPATAYFSGFQNDNEDLDPAADMQREPTAHTDAQAHFAYSTTLRRHHVDSAGYAATPIRPDFLADGFTTLLGKAQRTWDNWRSGGNDALLENGWAEREPTTEAEPPREGKSGQFASWSVEVRVKCTML
jgi:P-type Ca2+ transporter type 2C